MTTINIELSTASIEKAKQQLREYRTGVKTKCASARRRMAIDGAEMLTNNLHHASYDGEQDFSVNMELFDKDRTRITASGKSVIFMEFGTGIRYMSLGTHPLNHIFGTGQGTYSKKGKWDSPNGWVYVGNPGKNGRVVRINKEGTPVVRTVGNPAYMPVYKTAQMLRLLASDTYRREFRK